MPYEGVQRIQFSLGQTGLVDLALFDVSGRRIRTFLDAAALVAGHHEVVWDGRNDQQGRVAAGVYFYRLRSPDGEQTARTVVKR